MALGSCFSSRLHAARETHHLHTKRLEILSQIATDFWEMIWPKSLEALSNRRAHDVCVARARALTIGREQRLDCAKPAAADGSLSRFVRLWLRLRLRLRLSVQLFLLA